MASIVYQSHVATPSITKREGVATIVSVSCSHTLHYNKGGCGYYTSYDIE